MERRLFLKGAALAGAGATLAAPAIAQERKTMVIVSTWPRDFPGVGTSAQRLAERITALTEGRITTEYYAAGERVGAFDSFDEVASGNSQAYIAADYYWAGKHPSWPYFCTVPFGFSYNEMNAWIKFRGGQELWDELGGQFGIKSLHCGTTGTQAGGWFNRELNSVDDLKGLKMRIPGLGGQVMAKLGVSTISLPGGQIYENLVSGSIDAADWIGPWNDYFLKLYEAAKFYYTSGFQEPGANISMGFNAAWWGSLTDWEKRALTAAVTEELSIGMDEGTSNNGVYLRKLVDEHGVQLRAYSDDTWDGFGDAAMEVFDETRQHSDIAERIHASFEENLRDLGDYTKNFETNVINQRNRVFDI
ncbi:MAG: TRAP transporter substrate-binding protein [Pikeienuella sp.]